MIPIPEGKNIRHTPSSALKRLSYAVPEGACGKTVEQILRSEMQVSRALIRRAKFMDAGITLDGVRVFSNAHPRPGQILSIIISDTLEEYRASTIEPSDKPVDIVYEDDDLLVIDKQPGVAMYTDRVHPDDTLANRMTGYYRATGQEILYHPIHRLDVGTSGMVVVAKDGFTQEHLTRQLHTQALVRQYVAVCQGVPEPREGVIDAPIDRAVQDWYCKFEVAPTGKTARTHYLVEKVGTYKGYSFSLVRCQLETGRTHQIRLHMSHIGCPLVGEWLYDNLETSPYDAHEHALGAVAWEGDYDAPNRPLLHSEYLSFFHPITHETVTLHCPLPSDMQCYAQLADNAYTD